MVEGTITPDTKKKVASIHTQQTTLSQMETNITNSRSNQKQSSAISNSTYFNNMMSRKLHSQIS